MTSSSAAEVHQPPLLSAFLLQRLLTVSQHLLLRGAALAAVQTVEEVVGDARLSARMKTGFRMLDHFRSKVSSTYSRVLILAASSSCWFAGADGGNDDADDDGSCCCRSSAAVDTVIIRAALLFLLTTFSLMNCLFLSTVYKWGDAASEANVCAC